MPDGRLWFAGRGGEGERGYKLGRLLRLDERGGERGRGGGIFYIKC